MPAGEPEKGQEERDMRRAQGSRGAGAKVLWGAIVIGVLMTGWMVEIARSETDPCVLTGKLTRSDTGEHIANNEIAIKNLRTNEIKYTLTNEIGDYEFELVNFEQGWQYGDHVSLRPSDGNGLFGYETRLYLSPYVRSYTYTMDLTLIPIDEPDYYYDYLGNMNTNERDEDESTISWSRASGGNIHVADEYEGVYISVGWSNKDYGQSIPAGHTYYVEINYTLKIVRNAIPPTTLFENTDDLSYYVCGEDADPHVDPTIDAQFLKNRIDGDQLNIEQNIHLKVTEGDQLIDSRDKSSYFTVTYWWT